MNILFVCSGNVSRSFLAETLLKNEIGRLGIQEVSVASAGLHAFPGSPADPKMVAYLTGMGITPLAHQARVLSGVQVQWADLILVMEAEQALRIDRLWPGTASKVHLLGRCLPGTPEGDDILDPFGRTVYHYRLAQSQITLAVKSLAQWLLSGRARGVPCSESK